MPAPELRAIKGQHVPALAGTLPPGTIGGDSDSICTPGIAKDLFACGIRFLFRYISRTTPNHSGDLTAQERLVMLNAGLAVGYVQHVPLAGWAPSRGRGAAYGIAAVDNLRLVGATPGVCVWRDWEGILPGSSSADCIADINAWNAEVKASGYVPGIYVGFDDVLTASQLYWRLTCSHYWRDYAPGRIVPAVRGYQILQSQAPSPVDGYDFDRDVIMQDALGGLPIFDLS
jgi:hypothetical protein